MIKLSPGFLESTLIGDFCLLIGWGFLGLDLKLGIAKDDLELIPTPSPLKC